VIREGFGLPLVESYSKLKHAEWKRYAAQITAWERETTLDC
jgi:glutamine synthetase